MKKVYMIKYAEVDKYSFGYQEDVSFDTVAFTNYQAASYFLLNMEFVPFSNTGRGNEKYLTWENYYGIFAEIEELTIIQ